MLCPSKSYDLVEPVQSIQPRSSNVHSHDGAAKLGKLRKNSRTTLLVFSDSEEYDEASKPTDSTCSIGKKSYSTRLKILVGKVRNHAAKGLSGNARHGKFV